MPGILEFIYFAVFLAVVSYGLREVMNDLKAIRKVLEKKNDEENEQ